MRTLVLLCGILMVTGVANAAIVDGVDTPGGVPLTPPGDVVVERGETSYFINFDDVGAPCVFASQNPLRSQYLASHGVDFTGPGPLDGGAVLDQCGGFGVSGHSAPNFLAFNCNSMMANGGIPTGPETMTFTQTITYCGALVGSGSGAGYTLTMDGYDAGMQLVDSDSVVLASTLQLIQVAGSGIKYVVVGNTQPCVWVLDDLGFDTEPSPVEDASWTAIKALYR